MCKWGLISSLHAGAGKIGEIVYFDSEESYLTTYKKEQLIDWYRSVFKPHSGPLGEHFTTDQTVQRLRRIHSQESVAGNQVLPQF